MRGYRSPRIEGLRGLRLSGLLDLGGEWAEGDSLIAGKLVLYGYQRCPRVVSDSGLTGYVPLWPLAHGTRVENGEIEILVNETVRTVQFTGTECVVLCNGRGQ
jgi:hypothetical protein